MSRRAEISLVTAFGTVGIGLLLLIAKRERAILETLLAYAEATEKEARTIAHMMRG